MKILIIRFSSMGDIVQAMSVVSSILAQYPKARIEWVTKKEFAGLVGLDRRIFKIWSFDPKEGFLGLVRLGFKIESAEQSDPYDMIYDAHQNLRSLTLKWILRPFWFLLRRGVVARSKERLKRILLFSFKRNFFSKPYRGMLSYLRPLAAIKIASDHVLAGIWNFSPETQSNVRVLLPKTSFIALAPSAAWPMKRWPLEHWVKLVMLSPKQTFILLGGSQDHFLGEIVEAASDRVINLAGKLSLNESAYAITCSELLVSADTGMIHMADLLGHPGISLMGPTAFGFCSGQNIKTLEVDLPCRPCTKDGRGHCQRAIYQECMVSISPGKVVETMLQIKQFRGVSFSFSKGDG